MSLLATVLAATEVPAPLFLPNWAFAAIAFAVFLTLAFVSWSFRDVANRHSDKTSRSKAEGDSHGAGH